MQMRITAADQETGKQTELRADAERLGDVVPRADRMREKLPAVVPPMRLIIAGEPIPENVTMDESEGKLLVVCLQVLHDVVKEEIVVVRLALPDQLRAGLVGRLRKIV